MGLFDFVGNIASSAVKLAATPVAATIDIASSAIGVDSELTKNTVKSAGKDLQSAVDEVMP